MMTDVIVKLCLAGELEQELRATLTVDQRAAFGDLWRNFVASWLQRDSGPDFAEMIIFGGRNHAPVPWSGALKKGGCEALCEMWDKFIEDHGVCLEMVLPGMPSSPHEADDEPAADAPPESSQSETAAPIESSPVESAPQRGSEPPAEIKPIDVIGNHPADPDESHHQHDV